MYKKVSRLKHSIQSGTFRSNSSITVQETNIGGHNQGYVLNDKHYWDKYVREWEKSEENKELKYLGNEWKGEDIFLSLLKKYSNHNHRALEIGCGGGRVTSTAVKLFKHLEATDVSKEMLRKCRESVKEPNITFHEIDGFTLKEFDDDSVDFVFSHDVFVHFSSLQVYPYFMEMKRVLKKGAVGLVSFYNFRVHFDLFKEMSLNYYNHRQIPYHMRIHFVTEEMLRIMLQDLKMGITEIDRTHFLIVAFCK
jgi:ubiquinone/menaquinone biosynthesis C-methylase UbiE